MFNINGTSRLSNTGILTDFNGCVFRCYYTELYIMPDF